MNQKTLFALWGGLFALCAGLGFIDETAGFWHVVLVVLALAFFIPPAVLLYRADQEKDNNTLQLIRNFSALSLLLTMVLRLIPNFIRKTKQIIGARKSIGKGAAEQSSTKEKLLDGMTVLSSLTDWALEGSVVTGDSMRARGYGTAKRSSFMIYRMKTGDWLLIVSIPILLALIITAACLGQMAAAFTPEIQISPVSWGILPYTAYLLIPIALHTKEAIQWHISRSKI